MLVRADDEDMCKSTWKLGSICQIGPQNALLVACTCEKVFFHGYLLNLRNRAQDFSCEQDGLGPTLLASVKGLFLQELESLLIDMEGNELAEPPVEYQVPCFRSQAQASPHSIQ